MLAFILFALLCALYINGLLYFILTDVRMWAKQGIPFSWSMVDWYKFAWPYFMWLG